MTWFKQCKTMTYEQLADPTSGGEYRTKRWARLDHLLMTNLPKIFPKKLKEDVDKIMIKLYQQDVPQALMGRQLVYMMYEFFRTETSCLSLYTSAHIMSIKFGKDTPEGLRALTDVWDLVWGDCA